MKKIRSHVSFYPVIIEACTEGGYFAKCELLQGCHAEGKTYGEVIDNIRSVIETHVKLRKKHGEQIPFIEVKEKSDVNIHIPIPVGI